MFAIFRNVALHLFFFFKKMYFEHSFIFLGSEFEQKRAFQETMYLFSSVLFFVANKESGKAADQTSSNVEKPSLKFMDLVQCFFEDFRTSEMFVYYDELSGHIQTKSIKHRCFPEFSLFLLQIL